MKAIKKIKPSINFFPSLEQLHTIKEIKLILKKIMKNTKFDSKEASFFRSFFKDNNLKINNDDEFLSHYTYAVKNHKDSENIDLWNKYELNLRNLKNLEKIYSYISYLNEKKDKISIHNYKEIQNMWGIAYDSPDELFNKINWAISQSDEEPVKLEFMSIENIWIFKGWLYQSEGRYSDEEFKLLIFENFDKERRYFEKLKKKFENSNGKNFSSNRPRLLESVKIEVWRRDGGKCVKCGNRENLEYDHIIPFSKGGSNTSRNIELLCENCNRKKGNNIE